MTARLLILSVLALGACVGVSGQSGGAASASGAVAAPATQMPRIDSARLMGDLFRLSHDSMAGRAAMTPENARARAFLAAELRRLGIEPLSGRYEHPFAMPRRGRADTITGANVLGYIPGSRDPQRVIVVSAHYDHVGVRNGAIHNGADDNASGTAALLQIAAALRATPPQHSVVIAFLDAEEVGLVGARAFVADPPLPLPRLGANVNLDMVARGDQGELWAAGASRYPAMRPLLERLAAEAPVRLRIGHDSGGGRDDWTNQSDQGAFHAAGIPFVYFGVEDHPDYHKPTDDPEKVDPGFYVRAVRTITAFVMRLDADLPPR